MNVVQARFAEIERNTGLSFSAHLQKSQAPGAVSDTDPVAFAELSRIGAEDGYDGPGSLSPVARTGGFARLPESEFDSIFAEAGERYGLDATLIKAVAYAESTFRPTVVSRSGAMGLMQLMPATAEALGVNDPFDPWQNVDGGARYLSQLLDRFDGNALLALAAYNCGSGRITSRGITDLTDSAQRDLLPAETRSYLANIERYLRDSQALHILDNPFAA
jgi:soluble lytic murein transglycosylase-like protein